MASSRPDAAARRNRPGAPTAAAPSTTTGPRFAAAWAALVYAVSTMALGYPALAGRFLINISSDQYFAGYAFREYAAQSLRSGHGFPQWNPYLTGGLPYIAAMHGDIFYPTFLLRMIMPTDAAMTWEFIIHLFLAGCFTYGFLRAWGLGFFPSLVGGLAYLLSGWMASYAYPGHDGKLFVSTLLPLVLWLLLRGIRDGRAWSWGALALVIGLATLAPHPQVEQYMLLAAGAFALFVAFGGSDGREPLPRDVALKRLGLALTAVIVGLVIGAVQFLPVREYVPFSPRAGGRGYDYATSFSFPIEELINTYLPQFSGILDNYWGRNFIHLHSEYIGAVVLMLAGAAFGRTARRGFRWFWVGIFVVSLLWSLGGYTPFYQLVYALVPGAHYFRAPSTMFFVTTFAVAVFAALGMERFEAGLLTPRYALGWVIAGVLVALVATAGGFTNMASVIAANFPGVDQQAIDQQIAGGRGALIAGSWRSFLFVLLAAGVVIGLAREVIRPRAAAWALVMLAALDLWSIGRIYWTFSDRASKLFATDPAIEYLKKAPPARVLPLQMSADMAPQDPFIKYDGLMVQGIRQVLGYHGNELGRFETLFGKAAGGGYVLARVLNEAAWRHENVQYLYTNADEVTVQQIFTTQLKAPPPIKVLGPVHDAEGSTIYLYKFPFDNPPAWLSPVMVKAPEDQAMATVLDPRFDPTRATLVDTDAVAVKTQQIQTLPPPIATHVTVTRYEPEHISLVLDAPSPNDAALVVSENYYPGWTAVADGRPAPVVRADYNLIGVQLPGGTTHVELSFRDQAYETGKTVTFIALIVAVLALGAGVFVTRSVSSHA